MISEVILSNDMTLNEMTQSDIKHEFIEKLSQFDDILQYKDDAISNLKQQVQFLEESYLSVKSQISSLEASLVLCSDDKQSLIEDKITLQNQLHTLYIVSEETNHEKQIYIDKLLENMTTIENVKIQCQLFTKGIQHDIEKCNEINANIVADNYK